MDGLTPGHKVLSTEQLDQMGRIRTLKAQLADELNRIALHNHEAMPAVLDADGRIRESEVNRSNDALFEARRFLSTGFMWLTRAIANPEGL